jgi:hypothetical protein
MKRYRITARSRGCELEFIENGHVVRIIRYKLGKEAPRPWISTEDFQKDTFFINDGPYLAILRDLFPEEETEDANGNIALTKAERLHRLFSTYMNDVRLYIDVPWQRTEDALYVDVYKCMYYAHVDARGKREHRNDIVTIADWFNEWETRLETVYAHYGIKTKLTPAEREDRYLHGFTAEGAVIEQMALTSPITGAGGTAYAKIKRQHEPLDYSSDPPRELKEEEDDNYYDYI